MAASVRFKLDHPGVRRMLASDEMQKEMNRRAEEVAQRARARHVMVEGDPGDVALPVEVQEAGGASRARALVILAHPAGLAVEAKHRLLGGALG